MAREPCRRNRRRRRRRRCTPVLEDVTGPATSIGLPELLQVAVRQAPALASAQIDIEIAEAQIEGARAWADWAVQAQLAAQLRTGSSGQVKGSTNYTLSGRPHQDDLDRRHLRVARRERVLEPGRRAAVRRRGPRRSAGHRRHDLQPVLRLGQRQLHPAVDARARARPARGRRAHRPRQPRRRRGGPPRRRHRHRARRDPRLLQPGRRRAPARDPPRQPRSGARSACASPPPASTRAASPRPRPSRSSRRSPPARKRSWSAR